MTNPTDDWISVEDGLPEFDERVLIYPKPQHRSVMMIPRVGWPMIGYNTRCGGWFSVSYGALGSGDLSCVGWWMPLPTAPKGHRGTP